MSLLNRCPRIVASSTILLCLVPLSYGLVIVLGMQVERIAGALSTGEWRGIVLDDVHMKLGKSVLIIAAHAGAVLGLAALWCTLTPKACGSPLKRTLRPWQRLSLKLGIATSLVYLLMFALNPERIIVSLPVIFLFAWPAVLAVDMLRGSES